MSRSTFWEGVQTLTAQTSYEPVFRPYGQTDEGLPIIWLRRVDVQGEQKPAPAVASGPVLVRATEARVTIDLRMSSLRMAAPQAAVRVELFLEPRAAGAIYVTAAALRAFDEEQAQLRRAEGHDPTTRIQGGIGELFLHLDAVTRIPTDVARWQAVMRIVESKDVARLRTAVTAVPETRKRGIVAKADDVEPETATKPATAPAAADLVQLGPYRLALDAVRVGERTEAQAGDGAPARIATFQCIFARGEIDPTAWSRLFGFLVASQPGLVPEGEEPSAWRPLGYAVVAIPSTQNPEEPGAFRVWAQFEAPAGTADPEWLVWTLPVASAEQRAQIMWGTPLTIQPMAGSTRPAGGPEEVLEPKGPKPGG